MVLSLGTISGVLALCTSVVAHGQITGIVAGGIYYQGYLPHLAYQKSPSKLAGWSIPRDSSNGPVYPASYNNPDIICHVGGTPGAISAKVTAGQTVELQWTPWPVTHHGPVLDYLANCNGPCSDVDKTRLRFNKIDATGLLRNSAAAGQAGYWAADQLRATNNSWTVTIPSAIAAGNYVLRHEIIALHSARIPDGAQNYPHCINLEVTGSGTDKLASGTLGTNLYKESDPGIEIDIYKPLAAYDMPGPPLYVSGGILSTPAGSPPPESLASAQADNYGSTAMEASKIKASAVPKMVQPSVETDDQKPEPSTAAPSPSATTSPTDNGSTVPSSTAESRQQQLDTSNPDSRPKAQALRPSFLPHPFQNSTNSTTTPLPNDAESKSPEPPTGTELDNPNPAASTPQQEADQPAQPPSPTPTHKTPKPCHRHRHHQTPPPKASPPSIKKLPKKPCTARRRPTSSSTAPPATTSPQAQQTSPATTTSASNAAGTGAKHVKGKACKRRRRRQSS